MVSSTFKDLKEHRAALMKIIEDAGFKSVGMEHDSAKADVDVLESSLNMVRDSAAYVGVIGQKLGQIPICPDRNPDGLSVTELEFKEAVRLGRPILLFLMADDHPLTKADFELTAVKRKKLEAFRKRAKRMGPDSEINRVYAAFGSLDDFRAKASHAIHGLKDVFGKETHVKPLTAKDISVPPKLPTRAPKAPEKVKPPRKVGGRVPGPAEGGSHYVLFARIVGIDGRTANEIAGIQKVLLLLAKEIGFVRHQPSLYGRVYFGGDILDAIKGSESLLKKGAEKGVRLAIGISKGTLVPNQDLGLVCLQGPAISDAARLSELDDATNRVVVSTQVFDTFNRHPQSALFDFGEEKTGRVRESQSRYRQLHVSPGSTTGQTPNSKYTGYSEGQIVVYELVGSPEVNVDAKLDGLNRLRKSVMDVAGMLNLSSRMREGTLWYAPGGDGGALIFSGEASGGAAWELAKRLRDHCEGKVAIRMGIACGLIAVVPGCLPVGTGVLRAERCSLFPPAGRICLDRGFWEETVPSREKESWKPVPVEKDPRAFVLAPRGGDDDWAEIAARAALAEASESVRRSLEQFPELKRILTSSLKRGDSDDAKIISDLLSSLVQEDLNEILKLLWNSSKSSDQPQVRDGIQALMQKLPQIGVKEAWVRKVRQSLEHKPAGPGKMSGGSQAPQLRGGIVHVSDNVWMPSAELLKAAIYGGPCQWAAPGGNWPRGENVYHPSMVESAATDANQRLRELQEYVLRKAGPAKSSAQRNARIQAFLELELENQTPFYILLDEGDPLLGRLTASGNHPWKDALLMVRTEKELPPVNNLEKTEGYIKRILSILSTHKA